eukprot:77336_1
MAALTPDMQMIHQLETDIGELKRQGTDSMLIIQLEGEIHDLHNQLRQIQEQIRQKNTELSTIMARSVSPKDIDDVLSYPDVDELKPSTSTASLHSQKSNTSSLDTPKSDASLQTPSSDAMSSLSIDLMDSKDDPEYITPISLPASPISCATPVSPSSVDSEAISRKKRKKKSCKKRKSKKGRTMSIWKKIENEIKSGNVDYVEQVVQYNRVGINDREDKTGRTMLMMAAAFGQYDICGTLIESGSNIGATTKSGGAKNAKYFAHKNGHQNVERLLVMSTYGGVKSPSATDVIKTLKEHYAV